MCIRDSSIKEVDLRDFHVFNINEDEEDDEDGQEEEEETKKEDLRKTEDNKLDISQIQTIMTRYGVTEDGHNVGSHYDLDNEIIATSKVPKTPTAPYSSRDTNRELAKELKKIKRVTVINGGRDVYEEFDINLPGEITEDDAGELRIHQSYKKGDVIEMKAVKHFKGYKEKRAKSVINVSLSRDCERSEKHCQIFFTKKTRYLAIDEGFFLCIEMITPRFGRIKSVRPLCFLYRIIVDNKNKWLLEIG
eukprot:TRINITY_DN27301_c0_g1_i1.p1 TRINITY_DN27301_c0_g1~~TRINITY_DN27301_c0_g1_i1.p1  ORF type:complete len:262 (+),score=64.31 TRINITY_DN27301_c0_g1_i1:44-787(+)